MKTFLHYFILIGALYLLSGCGGSDSGESVSQTNQDVEKAHDFALKGMNVISKNVIANSPILVNVEVDSKYAVDDAALGIQFFLINSDELNEVNVGKKLEKQFDIGGRNIYPVMKGTHTYTFKLQAPSVTSENSGTYHLLAYLDPHGAFSESNETNNNAHQDPNKSYEEAMVTITEDIDKLPDLFLGDMRVHDINVLLLNDVVLMDYENATHPHSDIELSIVMDSVGVVSNGVRVDAKLEGLQTYPLKIWDDATNAYVDYLSIDGVGPQHKTVFMSLDIPSEYYEQIKNEIENNSSHFNLTVEMNSDNAIAEVDRYDPSVKPKDELKGSVEITLDSENTYFAKNLRSTWATYPTYHYENNIKWIEEHNSKRMQHKAYLLALQKTLGQQSTSRSLRSCVATTGPSFNKAFDKAFDDKYFGAGVHFDTSGSLTGTGMQTSLSATVPMNVFTANYTLIDIESSANYNALVPTSASFSASLSFNEVSLWSKDGSSNFSYSDNISYEKSITEDELLMVGPVPVTLSAGADATIGTTFDIALADTFKANMTPNTSVGAVATASIGAPGFSAGIEGTLNLVENSFPVTIEAQMQEQNNDIQGTLSISASDTLTGPNGTLSAFVEYPSVTVCCANGTTKTAAPQLYPLDYGVESREVSKRCILHSVASTATTVVNTTATTVEKAAGTVVNTATSIGDVAEAAATEMDKYADDAANGVVSGAQAAAEAGAEFAQVVGQFACFPCDASLKKSTYSFVNFQTTQLSQTLLSQQLSRDICQ
jgi:hypothetical protein